MLVVEGAVFAVNGYRCVIRKTEMSYLWDRARVFHIRSVHSGAENAADPHLWICIGRSNKGPGGVVDQGSDFDWQALSRSERLPAVSGASFDRMISLNIPVWPVRLPMAGQRPGLRHHQYQTLLSTFGGHRDRHSPGSRDTRM